MSQRKLCPSFYGRPGALLLGRVTPEGKVGFLREAMEIDEAFLLQLHEREIEPEVAFRFAGPCHETACRHWSCSKCQLIEGLVTSASAFPDTETPACSLREACRWHHQQGPRACEICPFITRLSPED
jgi:hypothetical protein